jgi:hypothetical protein
MPLLAGALLAVVALVGTTSAGADSQRSVPSGVATGPLVTEGNREYTTMVATRYQHHNQESEVDHTYFYDCVGFVAYAMSRGAPTASTTSRDTLKTKKGYVPSPASYVGLFDKINTGASLAGWAPITSVATLQPGDVVAWYYDASATSKPGSASGHAVIIGAPPTKTGPDAYSVLVYDSTGTPHGPQDTRLTNPANQKNAAGKPSGLGQGTIGFLVTPNGAISSVQWSAGGKSVRSAHYGMARPVS